MKNNTFRFKTFSVLQEHSAMKVGTDGVLLGAWATRECGDRVQNILDIGSGTGVISLIVAHRCENATITAIEIDSDASKESKFNFDNSDWNNRLNSINCSLQDFVSDSKYNKYFDTIITNPPYFVHSLKNPDMNKVAARHAELLTYQDLVDGADKLLSEKGEFYVILPYKESALLITLAALNGLYLRKRVDIYGSQNSDIKRSMMLFTRVKGDTAISTITIRQNNGYSNKYIELTKDLYLNF